MALPTNSHQRPGRAGQRDAGRHGRWQWSARAKLHCEHRVGAATGPGDTGWPPGPKTVIGPASMIRACRRPPRFPGCSAMLQPRFQVLLAAEDSEQVLHRASGLRANFANLGFLSKKTRSGPSSLAAARVTRSGPPSLWRHHRRHGPSHSRSPCNSL